MRLSRRRLCAGIAAMPIALRVAAQQYPRIRIGLLRFGSVSWEIEATRMQGFDRAAGIEIVPIEYAASPATQVALQAGEVDMIALDWLWVVRQRLGGADWTFAPLSSAVGGIVVPAASPLQAIGDLAGKDLGIAGTPIDKSWLVFRAYASRVLQFDPDTACRTSFGAPPLLASELSAGRLDAALTYWPYVAKAEAAGQRVLAQVSDWLAALEIDRALPMVGYVFSNRWADANHRAVSGFLDAALRARQSIRQSDETWRKLQPKTGIDDPKELAAIRRIYAAGIADRAVFDAPAAASAAKLVAVLREAVPGSVPGLTAGLPPGTFWRAPAD